MEQFTFYIKPSRIIPTLMLLILSVCSNAQSNKYRALPQYLYTDFSSAFVKMKNGQSQTSQMNYNMVTGKMVFEKDGEVYDLINAEAVDTIFMNNSKFIPFGKAFYEIIYSAPITLFLDHKGDIVPAGKEGAYGTRTQTSSITNLSSISTESGYFNLELPPNLMVKVDLIYWVNKDYNMLSFTNLKQFLKIFPWQETELEKFIKSNRIKITRRDDLIKLMSYCNDIVAND
jgi:hypothetical protein